MLTERKRVWMILTGMIGLFALSNTLAAAEPTIDDITFGKLLMGESVTQEDLKDHVVAIEFWGIHCPPCRASIPHLVKWYEKFSSKGLILIGFHSQNASKEEVVSFCKSQKVNYPIFQGGQIKGVNVRGIPHFCIFDHRGKLVFEGHPMKAEQKLEEVVENAPDPLIGEGPYKKLRSLARKICQRKGLGKIMVKLREKVENSTDAVEKEEAEKLLGRLNHYARRLKEKAEMVKDEAPLQCYNLYQQLAKEFKDDEIGTEAKQVLDALKKDKQFQRILKAEREFEKIKTIVERFKPCQYNKPLDIKNCVACRKKNSAGLQMVTTLAKRLLKRYPNTPTVQKVEDFLTGLSIKFE